MKHFINNSILAVCLICSFILIGCSDDNPVNPEQMIELSDEYTLFSITDKGDNITTNAGSLTDLDGAAGPSPEGILTGSIEFTETAFTFTLVLTPSGAAPITLAASGTYSINEAAISFVVEESGIPDVEVSTLIMNANLRGNRLTLEDDERRLVFDE